MSSRIGLHCSVVRIAVSYCIVLLHCIVFYCCIVLIYVLLRFVSNVLCSDVLCRGSDLQGGVALEVEYMDAGSLQDLADEGGCSREEVLANMAAQVRRGVV